MQPDKTEALVLAGARAGGDPLCRQEGLRSKALIDIGGKPMLVRVLDALAGSDRILERPFVSGLDPVAVKETGLENSLRSVAQVSGGPASSVLGVMEAGVSLPLLVTTCDHALLTPGMVTYFLDQAGTNGADLSVAMATRTTIRSAYPQTRRTYVPFRDEPRSGCNLFLIRNPSAEKAIRFWSHAERHRKQPLRILMHFGVLTALRLLLRRPTADEMFEIISDRIGVRIACVDMPFAEAAIDVDTPGDLELVRTLVHGQTT